MFDERKVAQIAAFFIHKEASCRMAVLKLVKLIYLADREAIDQFDFPMTEDVFVSMKHGPVVSQTYSLINGECEAPEWDKLISARANHEVSVTQDISRDDLDELSNADIKILETVWKNFGHMNKWEIRDYTHDYCSEWADPGRSSLPIEFKAVFCALGRSPDEAEKRAASIADQKEIDTMFAAL